MTHKITKMVCTMIAATAMFTVAASPAQAAGAPILPLSEVTPGMDCTAQTVIQGTSLSTFDVHIIDIIDNGGKPYLYIKVSGPGVDDTGIAEGYSGSPVWCPLPGGGQGIAGAISYGVGEWGNKIGLATPIESVIGTPISDPPAGNPMSAKIARSLRPLDTSISVAGLTPATSKALVANAAKHGFTVRSTPVIGTGANFPQQELNPGASIAALYSDGDVRAGGIGTVSYRDGNNVWAFGHPMDGAGARSLFMADAYIYGVVSNPNTSYKLGDTGHVLGTLTYDGPYGIAGVSGKATPAIPSTVTVHNLNTDKTSVSKTTYADERALGNPMGFAAIAYVLPYASMSAIEESFAGNPAAQTEKVCITVRFASPAIKNVPICNKYVGTAGGDGGLLYSPIVGDISNITGQIEDYSYGPPVINSIDVDAEIQTGLRQAYLQRVTGPSKVHPGQTVKYTLKYQYVRGRHEQRTVKVKVPDNGFGAAKLVFTGTAGDLEVGPVAATAVEKAPPKPRNLKELVRQLKKVERKDQVTAQFVYSSKSGMKPSTNQQVVDNKEFRLSGQITKKVTIQ